jgi:hypothetical protein
MSTRSQSSTTASLAPVQDLSLEENASTPKVYQWQYNGQVPWFEIMFWCYKNIDHGGHYGSWRTNGYDTIWFKDPKEYTAFLLRWS